MIKRKKIMILGASTYYVRSIIAAKEVGCKVFVTDKNPEAEGFRHADFYESIDITDIQKSIKAAKNHKVDGVIAVNDFGVQTAAAIASELNLPGISNEVAKVATNKARMRRIWETNNVPSAKFKVVDSLKDAFSAVEILNMWPLIVKPADSRGGGSRGVSIIENINQLKSAFEFAQGFYENKDVVIEEFLEGVEHSLETLTYDNITHVLAVSDKEKTPPPYRVDKSVIYPTVFDGEDLFMIKETAKKALKALGINMGAAHVEMCSTKNGPKLIEVGARCGGGGTPDPIIPWVTGVEMFKEVVRIALGNAPKRIKPLFNRGCVYRFLMPPPGKISQIRGINEIERMKEILDFDVFCREGDEIRDIKIGGDRSGFIIAAGQKREDAIRYAEKAEKYINFEYE